MVFMIITYPFSAYALESSASWSIHKPSASSTVLHPGTHFIISYSKLGDFCEMQAARIMPCQKNGQKRIMSST